VLQITESRTVRFKNLIPNISLKDTIVHAKMKTAFQNESVGFHYCAVFLKRSIKKFQRTKDPTIDNDDE
jgi:hypothetical protein